ncbi:metal ABC transporter solute-binding protein, Zn/Mn family [Allohahella sp. A8]|uniref:metal ABC transporter solute-binding protein, Zn/Mn family n=1 Tax=Allohahella sp. A8 TaxID=3141461 RepID=UPI003A7F77EB
MVIISSLKPFALLIDEVYGDVVESSYLVPPEQSPHHVTLKPSAVNRLRGADLALWAGPELESFLPNLLDRFEFKALGAEPASIPPDGARFQLAALTVLPSHLLVEYQDGKENAEDKEQPEQGGHSHALGSIDPHFWLSLDAVEALLIALEPVIVRLHTGNAHADPAREALTREKLSSARERFIDKLRSSFPLRGSEIVDKFPLIYSYHPAFNYLLADLGIPDEGYLTKNPESGVPPSAIAAFLEAASQNEVCMLAEPQYRQPVERLMARLADDAHARTRTVVADPLGVEAASFSELYGNVRKALRACLGAEPLTTQPAA